MRPREGAPSGKSSDARAGNLPPAAAPTGGRATLSLFARAACTPKASRLRVCGLEVRLWLTLALSRLDSEKASPYVQATFAVRACARPTLTSFSRRGRGTWAQALTHTLGVRKLLPRVRRQVLGRQRPPPQPGRSPVRKRAPSPLMHASLFADAVRGRTLSPENRVALNSGPARSTGFPAPVRKDSVSLKHAVAPEVLAAPTCPLGGGQSPRGVCPFASARVWRKALWL